MCGRIEGNVKPEEFTSLFGLQLPGDWRGSYAVAPSMPYPVVRLPPGGRVEAITARWGLIPPMYHGNLRQFKASTFNARSEDVERRPSFALAYREARRCLVMVQGFYEWTGPQDQRQAYFLARSDGRPMVLAGLWEAWQDRQGALETFTLLTCASNPVISPVHDRQPVILERNQWRAWLDPRTPQQEVRAMMRACRDELLTVSPVTQAVTRPRSKPTPQAA